MSGPLAEETNLHPVPTSILDTNDVVSLALLAFFGANIQALSVSVTVPDHQALAGSTDDAFSKEMEDATPNEKAGFQLAGADASSGAAPQQTPPLTPAPPQQNFSMLQTFLELPWHVVPFLFGMFALVEALRQGGWVDFFAGVRHCVPAPQKRQRHLSNPIGTPLHPARNIALLLAALPCGGLQFGIRAAAQHRDPGSAPSQSRHAQNALAQQHKRDLDRTGTKR